MIYWVMWWNTYSDALMISATYDKVWLKAEMCFTRVQNSREYYKVQNVQGMFRCRLLLQNMSKTRLEIGRPL